MKENCIIAQEQAQSQIKLSGYQLTNVILRNGKKLNLSPTETLLFSTLATYWNGKPIYPRINTLCENTGLSEKAVRNNIKSLIAKGFIIATKGRKNSNLYNINVSKVVNTVESGIKDRTSKVLNTIPMIEKSYHVKLEKHHHKEKEIKSKSDDDFSLKSTGKHEHITIEQVPKIIIEDRKIKDKCAYWSSLNDIAKAKILKQEKEQELKRLKQEEVFRQRRELEKQAKEQEQKERELSQLPLNQQWSRGGAIEYVKKIKKMGNKRFLAPESLAGRLIQAFEMTENEL